VRGASAQVGLGNRNIRDEQLEEIRGGPTTNRRGVRKAVWAGKTLHVVLFEPEIPHNTGAVARLCAATNARLHLVGRLGYQLNDARLKRAGLDYWDHVTVVRHLDFAALETALPRASWRAFSTKGRRLYSECRFDEDSVLIFGSETRGLPASLVDSEQCYHIPMIKSRVRSLNLATAVAIVLFEALRQQGFDGAGEGGGDA